MLHTSDPDIVTIDDDLVSGRTIPTSKSYGEPKKPWIIICADDDLTTHRSTDFALDGILIEGRPIQLISAFSAQETIQKVLAFPDTAAVLLDVVMESAHAGLEVIEVLREQLGRKALRIIVRTGAPGLISEYEAVQRFDISDWCPKSEMSQSKLLATVTLAIRAYSELRQLEQQQEGLDKALGFLERLAKDGTDAQLIPEILSVLKKTIGSDLGLLVQISGNLQLRLQSDHADVVEHISTDLEFEKWMNEKNWVQYRLESALIASTPAQISLLLPPNHVLRLQSPLVQAFCRALRTACIWRIKSTIEREQVLRDPSTGLLSRSGFIKRSQMIVEKNSQESWGLYLIDLAGFGRVNAALGHEAGDAILKQAAERLQKIAQSYPLGRIASDAFAILMPQHAYHPDRFDKIFSDPFSAAQFPVTMKTRTGAAHVQKDQPATLWLTQATAALDEAKASGVTGALPRWFDPALESKAVERIHISQKLFETLKKQHGLFMVYQPQINLKDGSIFGAEALIRWRDENGTLIPPDKFVPIAEQAGLVESLSDFALSESLQMMALSKNKGLNLRRISVNISAMEFESDDLIDRVQRALLMNQVAPELLELEITETAAAKDPERMIRILQTLRKLGVHIAIDDFGSGYSSLAQLARLPIDKLKIDRTFVRALGSSGPWNGIPQMIVDLAKSLSLEIVAEGVETPQQAEVLHFMGADAAQGWLYAKALEQQDFFEYIPKAPYLKF